MKLQMWNFKVRDYEPYEVPDEWKVKTYCTDMEESVNCAECGREMTFGEGYREELREQRRQNNETDQRDNASEDDA